MTETPNHHVRQKGVVVAREREVYMSFEGIHSEVKSYVDSAFKKIYLDLEWTKILATKLIKKGYKVRLIYLKEEMRVAMRIKYAVCLWNFDLLIELQDNTMMVTDMEKDLTFRKTFDDDFLKKTLDMINKYEKVAFRENENNV